jgi:hypothetical protein
MMFKDSCVGKKTDPSGHRRLDPKLCALRRLAAQKVDLALVQRVLFSLHQERSRVLVRVLPVASACYNPLRSLYHDIKCQNTHSHLKQHSLCAQCVSNSPGIAFLTQR